MRNENTVEIEERGINDSPEARKRDEPSSNVQADPDRVNRKSKIENLSRPKGKVAHLPPDLRRQVNEMLDYGDTYKDIAERLSQLGQPGFFYQNIQRWKEGGYKHWLRAQEKREETMIIAE